jgi:hypothetical protein
MLLQWDGETSIYWDDGHFQNKPKHDSMKHKYLQSVFERYHVYFMYIKWDYFKNHYNESAC